MLMKYATTLHEFRTHFPCQLNTKIRVTMEQKLEWFLISSINIYSCDFVLLFFEKTEAVDKNLIHYFYLTAFFLDITWIHSSTNIANTTTCSLEDTFLHNGHKTQCHTNLHAASAPKQHAMLTNRGVSLAWSSPDSLRVSVLECWHHDTTGYHATGPFSGLSMPCRGTQSSANIPNNTYGDCYDVITTSDMQTPRTRLKTSRSMVC